MGESKDQIRELTTRQQCRDKLPTWFGSRENFMHGFREVLGNAVDEVTNNFSKGIITVTLEDDMRTISVADTGRGIPIYGETNGKPNYVLLFETLFAGTNYDNNENGKITVGTNGVGTCVLNHTSTLFKVVSVRNGNKYTLTYEDGALKRNPLAVTETDERAHGSIFKFTLDPEVYVKTVYDPEELKGIVKRISATANKIHFKFKHKGEETLFHYDSFEDYFKEIAQNLTSKAVIGPENAYDRDNELNKIEILFSTSPDVIQESFLNMNWLPEQGTIHDGVIAGIRNYVNKYCQDQKLIDKKSNITMSDVEDSISYVCSMLSTNVEYANQTKLSTNKTLYRRIASEYIQSLLDSYLAEDPKEFKKFIDHILQVNKFNNKNTAAKQALKKKLNEKVDSLTNKIEDLIDCSEHGPNSELYIAEGKSALGSIVLARNAKNQAVIPLRGKILNCLKADYPTIFKNQIIIDLIKAIGCGIRADKKNKDLESFDIRNMRYGQINIATDADADGQQITCLIITMIYRLMPDLIESGYVNIIKTPLYEVKFDNDEMIYFFSETEKDENLGKIKGKYTISRCKGLGELEPETMATTAMNPSTRNIEKVTWNDAEKAVSMIEMFMGTDGSDRKEYIEQNLYKYIDGAIS
jgi:DNA gyrase subunit B